MSSALHKSRESKMNVDKMRTLCEDRILPILAERMGFEPKFKLHIVPKVIYDAVITQKDSDCDPRTHHGILVKNYTIFVKEEPLLIGWTFVHELLHLYYPRRGGESFLHYEMRIRFLSFSVFYGIFIYVLGREKALKLFDLIAKVHDGHFKLTIPDYLKK